RIVLRFLAGSRRLPCCSWAARHYPNGQRLRSVAPPTTAAPNQSFPLIFRTNAVPRTDVKSHELFDHLVGGRLQRERDGEAERIGRLGVDPPPQRLRARAWDFAAVYFVVLQCLRPGRKSVFCTATVRHRPSSLRTTRVPMLVRSFSSMSP